MTQPTQPKPCPDAVEAMTYALSKDMDISHPENSANAAIKHLADYGFTIVRQPAMSDAELEREADAVARLHYTQRKDAIMALAKQCRG